MEIPKYSNFLLPKIKLYPKEYLPSSPHQLPTIYLNQSFRSNYRKQLSSMEPSNGRGNSHVENTYIHAE